MKKLQTVGKTKRSLFIDGLSNFIKEESNIEDFVSFMIKNWASVTIEASVKTSLPVQAESFKNYKTFEEFSSGISRNLNFNESYKNKTFKKEEDFDLLGVKLKKLLANGIMHNGIRKTNGIKSNGGFVASAIASHPGGLKGINSQTITPMLTKENLLNSKEKTFSNFFMRFRFDLFYIDKSISLTDQKFQFGVIKIPVCFEITSSETKKYLNFTEDDLKKIISESIKEAFYLKFDELMSREFTPIDLIEHRCNSLFVQDNSIMEFFDSQRGKIVKKLIGSVSGDERDRMLKLLQEFMISDFN